MIVSTPQRTHTATYFSLSFVLTASLMTSPSFAQSQVGELIALEFEALLDLEVTSVAKREQKYSDAAAAVYVITNEAIRRSGVTSIPEALRLAPGVQVARIDGSKWAVSIRGFNNRFSNKLLVLIDGRSVYTPLFSGVYWDTQDTLIADIERIEVVRGPGGTLWGANAVNGVVNVITKHAKHTSGALVQAQGGSHENALSLRYGATLGDTGWFRAYIKGIDNSAFENSDGTDANDDWDIQRGGFRSDWQATAQDEFTFQGDFYDGSADLTTLSSLLTPPYSFQGADTADVKGSNLLGRWTRKESDGSSFTLQAYFDSAEREETNLNQKIETIDVDFHHHLKLQPKHKLAWGLGYRNIKDEIQNSYTVSFTPDSRDTKLISGFIQDEIKLKENIYLTLGTKYERNDYSGSEHQPSIRLAWLANPQHTVWTSLSRAVRTPSRAHSDIRINVATIPGATPTVIAVEGSTEFEAEELLAFELGHRGQFSPDLSIDSTVFYNQYDSLKTREPNTPVFEVTPAPAHLLISSSNRNLMTADTYGLEVAAQWNATDNWRLEGSYSLLRINAIPKSTTQDTSTENELEQGAPKNQVQLHSYLNLSSTTQLDISLYYVDELKHQSIPSYTRSDMRLGWRPNSELELSLAVLNLQDERHPEYVTSDLVGAEIPRMAYASITWKPK